MECNINWVKHENERDGSWTRGSARRGGARKLGHIKMDRPISIKDRTITCYVNNLSIDIVEKKTERTFDNGEK